MVTANSSTSSQYMAYRLNDQRFAISTGGYSNESGIEAGGNATKNRWQHVVYRQTGTTGELFVDGQLVVSSTSIPKCKTVFSSASPYNWIGRAPFSGDAYLSQTLVSDFRLYDSSIPDSDISALASITS